MMLKIHGLKYRYENRTKATLNGIELQIAAGEMVLLAGKSGCGKSTLIKAVTGLLQMDARGELEGEIFLDDKNVATMTPDEIGVLAGTMYQTPDDQLFAMTVEDELAFALENQGAEPEFIRRRVDQVLNLIGLQGLQRRSIHALSGGQRQRLALGSILVSNPKLLILDEPVSQMNPQGAQEFLKLLAELNRKEGMTILLIEHRVNELAQYFQRIVVMNQGQIVYDGSIDEVWNCQQVVAVSGLREPQCVKLCSLLGLSRRTASIKEIWPCLQRCSAEKLDVGVSGMADSLSDNSAFHESVLTKGKELLHCENVEYTYPGAKEATLHGLSFQLNAGEIVALMGINGAGKSSLMNLLAGLEKPTKGSVYLDNKPLQEALAEVGYLRQEADLMLLADSVLQELQWNNLRSRAEEIDAFLTRFGLKEYRDDFPLALSKGQRLRVILGAILARKPKLLLLDEPTTGQDQLSLAAIKEFVQQYAKQGGGVFFCTHDVQLAAEIASRVIIMEKGRLLADGVPSLVLGNDELLQRGGLVATDMLLLSRCLNLPTCITAEEVSRFVHA